MSYEQKLDQVRALLEAFNESASTKLNFDEFLTKLKAAGGVTDEALRQCRWEDITDFGIPKLLARQVADIFRQDEKKGERRKPLKNSEIQVLTVRELVERYDPSEPDNTINKRLADISKSQPCIVFNDDGKVNWDASTFLIQEIKDGYEPRNTYVVDGMPREIKKVNERADDYFDENPLFPGRPLRGSEQVCDITNRRWDGVCKTNRQLLYIALAITKELVIQNPGQAHDILDKLVETANIGWIGQRFPNAVIKFQKMEKTNELPSLKILRSSAVTSKRNDPFFGQHKRY